MLGYDEIEVGQTFEFQRTIMQRSVDLFLRAVGVDYQRHMRDEVEPEMGQLVPPHMLAGVLADLDLGHKKHVVLSSVGHRIIHQRPIRLGPNGVTLTVEERIVGKLRVDESVGLIVSRKEVFDSAGELVATYSARLRLARSAALAGA